MTDWTEECEYADEMRARAFVRRHDPVSASECIGILRKTEPDLNASREAFLIGLNGFPNRKKGTLTDGNVSVFNWMLRQAQEERLTSLDCDRMTAIASEVCGCLRVFGNTTAVVSAVLACLEANERTTARVGEKIRQQAEKGVSVIDAAKYCDVRKSIRSMVNRNIGVNRGNTVYTVRKYASTKLLEDYLESIGNNRFVHISEDGELGAEDLGNLQFMEPLRWIIRSGRFQSSGYPKTPPFFVYEQTD